MHGRITIPYLHLIHTHTIWHIKLSQLWLEKHYMFKYALSCTLGSAFIFVWNTQLFKDRVLLFHNDMFSWQHTYRFQILHACMNLTTNEMFNYKRYPYLRDKRGRYQNPFSRGPLMNLIEFFVCLPDKGDEQDIFHEENIWYVLQWRSNNCVACKKSQNVI